MDNLVSCQELSFKRKREQEEDVEGERNKMLCVQQQQYRQVTIYMIGHSSEESPSPPSPEQHGSSPPHGSDGCHSPGQHEKSPGPHGNDQALVLEDEKARICKAYDDFAKFWELHGQDTLKVEWINNNVSPAGMIGKFQSHTEDELVIPFFCGRAGGRMAAYRWHFPGCPTPGGYDAWSLLRAACMCKPDVMFIIDAFMHTRMKGSERLRRMRGRGNAEIFHAPAQMIQSDTGLVEVWNAGHMTESLVRNLKYYVDQIKSGDDKEFLSRVSGSLQSLNQITRGDSQMYSGILHYFYTYPHGDKTAVVTRVKLNPFRLKATGKLTFCREEYQGPGQLKATSQTQPEFEQQLAIWAQFANANGEKAPKWAKSRYDLEPWKLLCGSLMQGGGWELLTHINTFDTLTATRSDGKIIRMLRNGNRWLRVPSKTVSGDGAVHDGDQNDASDEQPSKIAKSAGSTKNK